MRNRQLLLIGTMILGALMVPGFSARMAVRYLLPYLLQSLNLRNGIEAAAGEQPADLARQGWRSFLEVLAGDQSKLEPAVRQLEQGAIASPADIHNLYTLGRAYFYDAITHNNLISAEKAERAFARVLELDPKHEALAFHGSALTFLSRGKDMEKFKQGVREMNRSVEQNPDSLTGRLSRAFTALALPAKARPGLGSYDPVQDLEFASRAFEGVTFHYAPQAEAGSKTFLGESYLLRGDIAKAQSSFKAALAVPLPTDPEAKAGRVALQEIIRNRLNGSSQSLTDLLAQAGLGTCNTCHLRRQEGEQSLSKTARPTAKPTQETPRPVRAQAAPQSELKVVVVGFKPAEGEVRVAVFNSEKDFLETPFKAGNAGIDGSLCHWQVSGLPSGWYAVAIYQDKNGNGKLDRNVFGMPLEPYGFSNNAHGVMGPPSFGDARFQLTGSSTQIQVRLE